MRTPEEKEKIVKEYLNGESATKLIKKYNLSNKIIYRWLYKYNQFGIEGLKSNTGKRKNLNAGLPYILYKKCYYQKIKIFFYRLELSNSIVMYKLMCTLLRI